MSGSFLLKACSLFICLFLVGSCNEKTALFDFSKENNVELAELDKGELVRYGYALQAALIQKPEYLNALNAQQATLVLSAPDLNRQDGKKQVWQYRSRSCVLDIFWNGQGTSTDYEFRTRRDITRASDDVEQVQDWQCLQTIIQDRRRAIEKGFVTTVSYNS